MFFLKRFGSIAIGLLVCLAIDAIAGGMDDFSRRLIILAGLYVTLSVSLNLINGITGQFSMGHAAFYQVGAYASGYFAVTFYGKIPWLTGPMWIIAMMGVSAIAAAIAGLIVGLPSLRLKGDYLGIVTLGFGEIIRIIVQNQEVIGGSYGMNVQPKFPVLFGGTGTSGVWMVWVLAFICIAVCRNLLKTVHGLPFLAVREDEVASSAMGVNVTKMKVIAFLIGSSFAGAAGALLAHYEGFLTPTMFTMDVSFIILTMVVLGGTGSITGSALAAAVLFYLPEKLRDLPPVPVAYIAGGIVSVLLMVSVMKRISITYHGPKGKGALLYFGTFFGAAALSFVLGLILSAVPSIAQMEAIEANRLRMVIFAGTLIILMLLRPQGVLGHHEFSWTWVRRVLGIKNRPSKAVSA
ncbi:MAG: branched-chain amino acid ABC transporter permease [Fimbriimonadaceae bacterium]|nr:branched-chain amino acid ABC transporter permease [Fimbriimonadaceae bacterium]